MAQQRQQMACVEEDATGVADKQDIRLVCLSRKDQVLAFSMSFIRRGMCAAAA